MSGYEITELGRIESAIDAIDSPTSTDVFQATRPFDERAIASVAAQRATAGGGGGGGSFNWCRVAFDTPDPLTQDNDFTHPFSAAEMTITAQSGSDFSLDTVNGTGAIVSAGGGMFQGGAFIGVPPVDGLDAGDTSLRMLWFAFTIGSGGLQDLGFDLLVPLTKGGWNGGAANTLASIPGIAAPGEPAIFNPIVFLTGNADADSVDLSSVFLPSFANLAVWQIA